MQPEILLVHTTLLAQCILLEIVIVISFGKQITHCRTHLYSCPHLKMLIFNAHHSKLSNVYTHANK